AFIKSLYSVVSESGTAGLIASTVFVTIFSSINKTWFSNLPGQALSPAGYSHRTQSLPSFQGKQAD
ncbi:MAG: hypothetical protein Q8K01_05960, partial [Sulfurimicrobium sp.]|nr:hypothetical protein [Sulfurimicrobium sp.]